ncbi:T9SS type A sorting domain-containing protein [bacterium]|nr:T9SS type A sorting domain-containing protein [bacterium]
MLRFLIVFLAILTTQFALLGQSVIVNEMSQGSDGGKEWVELLVIDNGVDLRGWELGDFDDSTWHSIAEFSSHSDWANVATGTIIVLYNSGDIDAAISSAGGEDTVFSDKSVIIPVSNSSYLTDTGPWGLTSGAFSNSDGDDCAAIRNSSDEIIHDMAVTHTTATVPSPGSGEVKYYTGNTVAGITDNAKWTEASSTTGTPGSGNGGDNSNWVDTSLPVELSAWAATSSGGLVVLSWTTESEIENQGFIIERRQENAMNMTVLSSFMVDDRLLGHGSSSTRNVYEFIDKNVEPGQSYIYQLADVDYHGEATKHAEISVTVKASNSDPKPTKMVLHSAFPNPFNPAVNLSFSLEGAIENLSLEIYDLQGAYVRSLLTGSYAQGTHDIIWKGIDSAGKQVASGAYLVHLTTPNAVLIQRVTLIR